MNSKQQKAYLDHLNLVVAAMMTLLWIQPMIVFWLTAFGPLKPVSYPKLDTSPSAPWFLFWLGLSILAWYLPESYFKPKAFEIGGRFYEVFGIRYFKRYVTNGDLINRWVRRGDLGYRLIKDRASVHDFIPQTYEAEKSHLVFFLMGVFTSIYAFRIGWLQWCLYLTTANILVNLYPILLQRYTRQRILRLSQHR